MNLLDLSMGGALPLFIDIFPFSELFSLAALFHLPLVLLSVWARWCCLAAFLFGDASPFWLLPSYWPITTNRLQDRTLTSIYLWAHLTRNWSRLLYLFFYLEFEVGRRTRPFRVPFTFSPPTSTAHTSTFNRGYIFCLDTNIRRLSNDQKSFACTDSAIGFGFIKTPGQVLSVPG